MGIHAATVAQIFNLLYRGFVICGACENPSAQGLLSLAECNSAIQQIENLRYLPNGRATTFVRLSPFAVCKVSSVPT